MFQARHIKFWIIKYYFANSFEKAMERTAPERQELATKALEELKELLLNIFYDAINSIPHETLKKMDTILDDELHDANNFLKNVLGMRSNIKEHLANQDLFKHEFEEKITKRKKELTKIHSELSEVPVDGNIHNEFSKMADALVDFKAFVEEVIITVYILTDSKYAFSLSVVRLV